MQSIPKRSPERIKRLAVLLSTEVTAACTTQGSFIWYHTNAKTVNGIHHTVVPAAARQQAKRIRPERVLELGTALGYTASLSNP